MDAYLESKIEMNNTNEHITSPLSTTATNENNKDTIIMHGYLDKKCVKRFIIPYQKRYMVLTPISLIYFKHKTTNIADNKTGKTILISDLVAIRHILQEEQGNKWNDSRHLICYTLDKFYIFRAVDEEMARNWCSAINKAMLKSDEIPYTKEDNSRSLIDNIVLYSQPFIKRCNSDSVLEESKLDTAVIQSLCDLNEIISNDDMNISFDSNNHIITKNNYINAKVNKLKFKSHKSANPTLTKKIVTILGDQNLARLERERLPSDTTIPPKAIKLLGEPKLAGPKALKILGEAPRRSSVI